MIYINDIKRGCIMYIVYLIDRQRPACSPHLCATLVRFTTNSFPPSSLSLSVVPNFISGKFTPSAATEFIDVTNPATNEVVARVPKSTQSELEAAVASAAEAFETWSETPVQMRQRIMLDYVQLIKRDQMKIAESITLEQGKNPTKQQNNNKSC